MICTRRPFIAAALAMLLPAMPTASALAGPLRNDVPVADFLAANGTAQVFAQIRQMALGHSGWLFVSRQWTTPAEILPNCARLGWATVGQIQTIAALAGELDYPTVDRATGRSAMPSFTVDGMPTITVADLHLGCIVPAARALPNCGLTADHQAVPTDGTKYLLTVAQWDEALALFTGTTPTREFKYGRAECEEFAFDFIAHLGRIGLGASAAGLAWLQMFQNGTKLPSGHVTVLCVDTSRRTWVLDPIYGKRHPLGYVGFRGYRGIYSDGTVEALADSSLIQTLVL